MKFGPVAVADATGAVLAHTTMAGKKKLKKGTILGDAEITLLADAGISTVIAAVLDASDMSEDEAARMLAAACAGEGIETRNPSTGRANLHAARAGVFTVNAAMIAEINTVDPAVTIATLAQHQRVRPGQMVATVKIIPFAVARRSVEEASGIASNQPVLAISEFRPHKVGLIQTTLPSVKASVLDKTRAVTEARLARSGSHITAEQRVAHDAVKIAQAIEKANKENDAILVFGASAVADRHDLIPEAIERAGGSITRFGMPVDPGNLLVLGELGGKPVLGAPGCARSPKENGFDWVLDRLFAGMAVTGDDIAAMGVGGLLKEMADRPEPRGGAQTGKTADVHAVILAAGRSTRMGDTNKLLARIDGVPLIRRVHDAVAASGVSGATIVLGHEAPLVREAIGAERAEFVLNADFAEGMATSLKVGLASVPDDAGGAMVLLGDMPRVDAGDIDCLIDAFRAANGTSVVRASHGSKPGNPVILPRSLFEQVSFLQGDTGARHLIEAAGLPVTDVEIGEAAAVDVDTPDSLKKVTEKSNKNKY